MEIRVCTEEDLKKYYALRVEVFVEEQGVSMEEELDAQDGVATPVVLIEQNQVIACGRMLREEDTCHLGRIAVKKSYRNQGYGKALCSYMIFLAKQKGFRRVMLHAQLSAVGFYEKLGFQSYGDVFLDAGIKHIAMQLFIL